MKRIITIVLLLSVLLGGSLQAREIKRGQLPNLAAKSLSFSKNDMRNGEQAGYNDSKPASSIEAVGKFQNIESWGVGNMIEDGEEIIFSQVNTWKPFNENFGYITDVTLKFYDENMKVTKEVWVDLPDTTHTVTVLNQFSRRSFNNDMKFEFMLFVHYFVDDEWPNNVKDDLYIINEDGEIIRKVVDCNGVRLVKRGNNFDQAFVYKVFPNNYSHTADAKIIIEGREAKEWTLEHTFEFDEILTAYYDGYTYEIVNVNDTQYILTAHYEKPWALNNGDIDPDTGEVGDPTPDLDNRFVVTLYDMSYELVKEMKFDLFGIAEHNLSFASFGFFSSPKYNISKNLYNNDNKFNLVYGMSRYIISCDCELTDYYLVDEDGEVLRELGTPVSQSYAISDVKGFNDQTVVVLPEGEGGGTFRFIESLTWEKVVDFEGMYHEELLSFNFDRVAFEDSYAYAFGLGQAEIIGDDIYGGIVYYNVDGREVKRVRFLLPQNVELWTPVINSETLNPHVFNVDDEVEYLSFMKQKGPNSKIISSFNIWKENGDVVAKWESNSTDGEFSNAGFTYRNGSVDKLYVSYINEATDMSNVLFYKLPFAMFVGGGDGTVENPYVISTAEELKLMGIYNSAHFILANDIDVDGSADNMWTPISDFKGSLNGNGKTISNVVIENLDETYAGFFANIMEGATVRNLNIKNIKVSGDSYTGGLAGSLWGATVSRCNVEGQVSGDSNIGGITGDAVLNAKIMDCSFVGTVTSKNGGIMGGIVGSLKTGSSIDRCFSEGEIAGNSSIGGIVGLVSNNATVSDCYSKMTVKGSMDIGGIAGSAKSAVNRNYATGNVTAKAPQSGFSGRAGGILGYTEYVGTTVVAQYNVAANDTITAPQQAHRINGYEDGGELDNNYANSDMAIGKDGEQAVVSSTLVKSNDGADKAMSEMNKAFFESLTWKFGNDIENPWVAVETGLPRLWFEFAVNGVSINKTNIAFKNLGDKEQLTATLYPEDATNKNVTWSSSNESVATVDENGLVTAVANGDAIITVTTVDGGFKATCAVNVNNTVAVTGVELNKTELEFDFYVVKGDHYPIQLVATVSPENATNKSVKWSSSIPEIASVDENGLVTPHMNVGTAIITVTTVDGDFTATCSARVQVHGSVEEMFENTVKIFHSDNAIMIDSKIELSGVMVYDISGKMIYNNNSNVISTNGWDKGIYIVRVVDNNNRILSRKINVR